MVQRKLEPSASHLEALCLGSGADTIGEFGVCRERILGSSGSAEPETLDRFGLHCCGIRRAHQFDCAVNPLDERRAIEPSQRMQDHSLGDHRSDAWLTIHAAAVPRSGQKIGGLGRSPSMDGEVAEDGVAERPARNTLDLRHEDHGAGDVTRSGQRVDSAEQSVLVFGSGRGETACRDHGVGDFRPRAVGCS